MSGAESLGEIEVRWVALFGLKLNMVVVTYLGLELGEILLFELAFYSSYGCGGYSV